MKISYPDAVCPKTKKNKKNHNETSLFNSFPLTFFGKRNIILVILFQDSKFKLRCTLKKIKILFSKNYLF